MNTQRNLRVGLIGLDTSHVSAFTKLLNDSTSEHHISGAKVVAGYPGGTRSWDKSWGRVEQFTAELRDQHGVTIMDTPEAVAESVDLVLINAVDGRVHRELFEKVASYHKPTFIDKPFATTESDARAMLDLADKEGIPLMSCSSLRYAQAFTQALNDESKGAVKGIECIWSHVSGACFTGTLLVWLP